MSFLKFWLVQRSFIFNAVYTMSRWWLRMQTIVLCHLLPSARLYSEGSSCSFSTFLFFFIQRETCILFTQYKAFCEWTKRSCDSLTSTLPSSNHRMPLRMLIINGWSERKGESNWLYPILYTAAILPETQGQL